MMRRSNVFACLVVASLASAGSTAGCGSSPAETAQTATSSGAESASSGSAGSGGASSNASGAGGTGTGGQASGPTPMCSTDLAPPDQAWTLSDVLTPGPYLAGYRTYTFTDPTRPTPANGIFPPKDHRDLPTKIWYPAKRGILGDLTPTLNAELSGEGPFPLLVHSHGFMSNQDEADYLAKHLASHGYVVVAATFPLTNLLALGGANIADVVNQPGDVSFLIDTLIARSKAKDDPLNGAIDVNRIALSGVSLGGATTYLATYHDKLKDSRVKAAISLAGLSAMFTPQFFSGSDVPALLLHGDIDAILDYQTNAVRTMKRAEPRAHLFTFAGGTHTGFASPTTVLISDNVDKLGCGALSPNLPTTAQTLELIKALGGANAGLADPMMPDPCQNVDALPKGLDPKRQQQLTIAAVFPYLELRFAPGPDTQALACQFLTETLPTKASELSYQ